MIITESFAETESGVLIPNTADLQKRCEDRIAELKEYTLTHLQYSMPDIKLRYDLKGGRAGTANSCKGLIRINYVLLKENVEHYIKQTLGHEYAHLITDNLWLSNLISKPTAHGREWKKVMRQLKLKPSRCHSYDISNAGGKKQRQWKYHCKCPKPMTVSTTIHNRIKKGRKYRCNKCHTQITRG
jgi:SprT protein